ncbi:MAG: S41 family peptidase [Nocardioidaceae bacterium]
MHDQHFRLYGAVDSSGALLGGLGGQSAVEINEQGDVLVIVVRTLMGDIADEAALATWVAGAVDHFSHDKILVDLRGNGGGNDGHTWNWAEPYLSRASAGWCRSRGWMVGDREAGYWNAAVWYELQLGVDNVPPSLLAGRHQPDSTDQLTPDVTDLAPGPTPWDGRMVIAVDGDTGSSGESSYWLLRHGFNAVGVGAPTKGMMEFGNIVRYVFPRSGLTVSLPTKHNDFGRRVEHVGMPVDVTIPADTPIGELVARFDSFFDAPR